MCTSTVAVGVVPLPASAPLFGAGLIAIAGLGWHTKRQRAQQPAA